jgi:hypothetical protein
MFEIPSVLKRMLLAEIDVRLWLGDESSKALIEGGTAELREVGRRLGSRAVLSPTVALGIGNLAVLRRSVLSQKRRNEIEKTMQAFGVSLVRVGGRVHGALDRKPRKPRVDHQKRCDVFFAIADLLDGDRSPDSRRDREHKALLLNEGLLGEVQAVLRGKAVVHTAAKARVEARGIAARHFKVSKAAIEKSVTLAGKNK